MHQINTTGRLNIQEVTMVTTKAKNQMSILGKEGDVKVEWDPDNKEEVEVAEKAFKENTKKGFKAFRQYDDGKPGKEMEKFDKYAEKVIFVPPVMGG